DDRSIGTIEAYIQIVARLEAGQRDVDVEPRGAGGAEVHAEHANPSGDDDDVAGAKPAAGSNLVGVFGFDLLVCVKPARAAAGGVGFIGIAECVGGDDAIVVAAGGGEGGVGVGVGIDRQRRDRRVVLAIAGALHEHVGFVAGHIGPREVNVIAVGGRA